jgi:vitamin B12/bleomycin/antimicrobial peptide transport system ATP-binding/permease protein
VLEQTDRLAKDKPMVDLSLQQPGRFESGFYGFLQQFFDYLRVLWSSAGKGRLTLLTVATITAIIATVVGQVRLNAWNKPFYDAIQQKDLPTFFRQLLVFLTIAAILLVLNVAQAWLREMIKLSSRQWLSIDLFDEWLKSRRAFLLASTDIGVNPDQRLHEDARHLTEISVDLGVGLFQALLLLASFIGVLWLLSETVVFSLGGHTFSIPGYMVWCALIYAATGSWLTWRVGRPLVGLDSERYAREADLRFALVQASEHAEGIALYNAESEERHHLESELRKVLAVMRQIVGATARLVAITSGYGWIAIVAPILMAAPVYFGGKLSFGELMVVVGAFYQVQQSLRWFVDNFGGIADWRATLLRVMSYRHALLAVDELKERGDRITYLEPQPDNISCENLKISLPNGLAELAEKKVEIAAGERVLIIGKPGGGKSTLFRAFAGLWPWGKGTLRLPPRSATMFLPQQPYVPPGSLRHALASPDDPSRFADADLIAALERAGLGRRTQSLDRTTRWEKELAIDEQKKLAFARLLLHKPKWIFSDQAIDLRDETIVSILEKELAQTAVVEITSEEQMDGLYKRTLHLISTVSPSTASPPLSTAPSNEKG